MNVNFGVKESSRCFDVMNKTRVIRELSLLGHRTLELVNPRYVDCFSASHTLRFKKLPFLKKSRHKEKTTRLGTLPYGLMKLQLFFVVSNLSWSNRHVAPVIISNEVPRSRENFLLPASTCL